MMVPDGTTDRDEISPSIDNGFGIIRCDPADRHTGDFGKLRPHFQRFQIGLMLHLFGRGREECAERHIVGPAFRSLHRQVAAVVASDPYLRIAAQFLARFRRIVIFLPQMDTIRLDPLGKRYAVIDDEGYIMPRADFLQRHRQASGFMLVNILHPKLKGSDRSGR